MSKYSNFRRRRPGALLLDFRTFRVRSLSGRVDPNFSRASTRKMRISRVAHVAERYFSRAKPRKILIPTIADVTESYSSFGRTGKIEFQWLIASPRLRFSRARVPNPYPVVAEPYPVPRPQKSRKIPGQKKRQCLIYFYVKIFKFSSPAPRSTFVGFSDV